MDRLILLLLLWPVFLIFCITKQSLAFIYFIFLLKYFFLKNRGFVYRLRILQADCAGLRFHQTRQSWETPSFAASTETKNNAQEASSFFFSFCCCCCDSRQTSCEKKREKSDSLSACQFSIAVQLQAAATTCCSCVIINTLFFISPSLTHSFTRYVFFRVLDKERKREREKKKEKKSYPVGSGWGCPTCFVWASACFDPNLLFQTVNISLFPSLSLSFALRFPPLCYRLHGAFYFS